METYQRTPYINKKILLLIGDIFLVFSAFTVAYLFRITIYEGGSFSEFFERVSWLTFVGFFIYIIIFYIFELYDVRKSKPDAKLLLWIVISVSFATCFVSMTSYLFPQQKIGRVLIGVHALVLVGFIFLWRVLFFSLLRDDRFKKNLLWIDFNGLNSELGDEFSKKLLSEYNLIGTISDYRDNPGSIAINGLEHYSNLESLIEEKQIDTIVLSENPEMAQELKKKLIDFKFKGIEILDFPNLFQSLFRMVPILNIKEAFFLFSNQDKSFQPFLYLRVKRVFDVVFACIGIVISFPLIIFAVLSIKFTSKGPVFYLQERLGLNEKLFTVIKFRTMAVDAEKDSGPKWSSDGDPRITTVGRFLRKSRIDELPQLINILKGDMSFVGPRPIRKHFADILTKEFPFYRLRFTVKPGLTGWAQVKGNYAGSLEGQLRKLEYELFYIQYRSTFMDIYIILKTVQTILFRPGQ